jgi:hypothetical protein
MPSKKFGALAEFRQAQTEPPDQPEPARVTLSPTPAAEKGRGRPAGKRSNPEYEPTTVLLRKQTKRKASRLLEDTESADDLSDLIERLLGEWISKHS